MRKGTEVANHSSEYKDEKKKRHRHKGKTKEDKKPQNDKMRKTLKKNTKGKIRQACIYIYANKNTAH